MKLIGNKGSSKVYYTVIGIVLAIAVIFLIKYVHDKDNGAVIQLPKVEVH